MSCDVAWGCHLVDSTARTLSRLFGGAAFRTCMASSGESASQTCMMHERISSDLPKLCDAYRVHKEQASATATSSVLKRLPQTFICEV